MFDVLATDYDGTLADRGSVSEATVAALRAWRASSRQLVLVTGRQVRDLRACFPELSLCDRVVAENGAVLFDPASNETRLLGEPAERALLDELAARGVSPLSVGEVIVATRDRHGPTVRTVLTELRSEREVVLNKSAVMIVPRGVGKASGLRAALSELRASAERTVAVGDAENDLEMLRLCGLGVAVADALPLLKDMADEVTTADNGAGVVELITRLLGSEPQRG